MKSIRLSLSALWRAMRLFVAACACAVILFSNVAPAYSLPNPFAPTPDKSVKTEPPSDPRGGEANLLDIEKGAQKTVNRDLDLLSGEEVTRQSNEGLNEVQGAADIEEQKRPDNSQGETIEGILKDKLEEATGQK